MNLILSMTLSGSVMVILCMILKTTLRRFLPKRIQYTLWRICLLYFLVPLPFLKKFYGSIPKRIGETVTETMYSPGVTWILRQNRAAVIEIDGVKQYNAILRGEFLFATVWVGMIAVILLYCFADYCRRKRELERAFLLEQPQDSMLIEGWKREHHVRRRIRVVPCRQTDVCFTVGFWKPGIIYSKQCTSLEKEFMLRHELIHIKRWDVLWQFLLTVAVAIHCWNPFVWLLSRQLRKSCESSCDEVVLEGRSEKEREQYMEMLIRLSMAKRSDAGVMHFAQKAGRRPRKGKRNKEIEERIRNIMNMDQKKKMGKLAAVLLTASVTILNSLTVFAYEDVQFVDVDQVGNYKDWNADTQITSELSFTLEGAWDPMWDGVLEQEKVYYDLQFEDEDGNIYPIEETSLCASCDHTYVSGIIRDHQMTSNGGCIQIIYKAERCSKCGNTQREEKINRSVYDVCPH